MTSKRLALRVSNLTKQNASKRMFLSTSTKGELVVNSQLEDESIMEHLVCPISKFPLRYDATRGLIICSEIRVAYPVRNGIPYLIPSEARILKDDEEA